MQVVSRHWPAATGETVVIREGRAGNGHYRCFYWSVEVTQPDGSRTIESGRESTWNQAFDAAIAAKRQEDDR